MSQSVLYPPGLVQSSVDALQGDIILFLDIYLYPIVWSLLALILKKVLCLATYFIGDKKENQNFIYHARHFQRLDSMCVCASATYSNYDKVHDV